MNGSSAAEDYSPRSPNSTSNGHSTTANGSGVATPIPTSVGVPDNNKTSGDRSPNAGAAAPGNGGNGASKKDSGPQDIATEKVGFSEDLRALKVLDKGFR